MIRRVFTVVFCGMVFCACQTVDEKKSAKQEEEKNAGQSADEANAFLTKVATNVFNAVEISRIAQQKASLTKVKEFAKNMITDYNNNIVLLQDLAARKNIVIHLTPNDVLKDEINHLSTLNGLEFDKAYIKWVIENHETEVLKYRQQAENGKDIETKAFASGKLPIIVHHLDMAKTLHDSMEKS